MTETPLGALPWWANAALFAAAASVTWIAGTRLSVFAKVLADRTRAGGALIGALLLGGVASLPELVMSITGAAIGDAELAITTLLGGVPATLVMLAICDVVVGGEPVSSRLTGPAALLHGVLLICVLSLLAFGMVAGDVLVFGAGAWSLFLAVVCIVAVLSMHRHERAPPPWTPAAVPPEYRANGLRTGHEHRPMLHVVLAVSLSGLATIAAGYLLAASGEAIAQQTQLGSTLVGMILGGIATSLPELSTIYAAVNLRQYEMAFGDAFGSNLFSIALIYLVDVAYVGRPVLNEATSASMIATLLGILCTAIYLAGLLRRSRFTVLRFGIDSVFALLAYTAGLVLMWRLS